MPEATDISSETGYAFRYVVNRMPGASRACQSLHDLLRIQQAFAAHHGETV